MFLVLRNFFVLFITLFCINSYAQNPALDDVFDMSSKEGKRKVCLNIADGLISQKVFQDVEGNPLEKTIFIIQNKYVLASDIIIPDSCVLKFDGGCISGKYTIKGNGTGLIAQLDNIFGDDVTLTGSWNVLELYPEWFGAISDINYDSSKAISNCIKTAYRIKSSVKFKRGSYKVCGNNPCGLEILSIREPDILYSEERNVNIDFANSHIYYYPLSETDCFAFVGYLRCSTWENLNLSVCQTDPIHAWGDVFSTNFGISGALHRFSHNKFRNIQISARNIGNKPTTFRRVLNIDCAGYEATHHDDLSIFEGVNSSGFLRYYYTTNSNSVSLSFNDCSITLNRDNSVLYDVDSPIWAGYNRFNNCHFTIMDCDNAVLVRLKSINQPYGVLYLNESRVEIRNTSTNWMYFDVENGKVFFNDFYSVNYAGIGSSKNYGRIKYGTAIFTESFGIYTPITLVGVPLGYDNQYESLIFNHSYFIKGDDRVVPYPQINYESSKGEIYHNRYEALSSADAFGNIVVKGSSDNTPNVRDRWLADYTLNNSRVPAINMSTDVVRLSSKTFNKYIATTSTPLYNIPCDAVVKKVSYTQYGYNMDNQEIKKMGLFVVRDGKVVKTFITHAVPNNGVPLVLNNDNLFLRAGDKLRCALLGNDNTEVKDDFSTMSYLELEYSVANWIGDLKKIYTTPCDDNYK